MRRKLIKQGKGAYTITLPIEWIEKNELKEKDELEISEKDNDILIKTTENQSSQIKTAKLHLDLYTKESYRSIIGSLYRYGYDEIIITYKDSKVIPILEKSINSLFGLELFFEESNRCKIKSIYTDEKTEIKLHIMRMIYAIKLMQNHILEDLRNQDISSKSQMQEIRNNILKQRDLILRIIKKQKLLDDKTFPYYTIALSLWSIARNYYHMYNNMRLEDLESVFLIEKTNKYFNDSFSKFEKMDESILLSNHKQYNKIFDELKKSLTKSPIISFAMGVVIETQLGQSSIYILNI